MTSRCKFVHDLTCEQVSERLINLEAENDKLREENAELRKFAREALEMTGNLLDDLSNLRKEFGIEVSE